MPAKQMDELYICKRFYRQLDMNLDKKCAMQMAKLEIKEEVGEE